MNRAGIGSGGGLLVWGLILALGVVGARLGWEGSGGLDTRRQTRPPPDDLPGAGTVAVEISFTDDGRRLVRHVAGESRLPLHPQRVVCLGWTDEVLALGITPVAAAADGRGDFPGYLADRLAGTVPLDGNAKAPDLEAIAAQRPDLIVASWFWNPSWEALERIAPTVLLQPAHWEWRHRVRDLATVLDRVTEGDRVLADFDAHLAAVRADLDRALQGRSVALLRIYAREFRLYGFGYAGPLLYGDLGFAKPAIVERLAWSRDVVRLSLEGLADVDAEVLLLMTEEGVPVSFQVADRLAHHPLWQALPAVRAGRVVEVPNRLMRGGLIARREMVDLLHRELTR